LVERSAPTIDDETPLNTKILLYEQMVRASSLPVRSEEHELPL
jgi:hypothetical protein